VKWDALMGKELGRLVNPRAERRARRVGGNRDTFRNRVSAPDGSMSVSTDRSGGSVFRP